MTAASHPKSPRSRKERRISVRGVRRDPPDLELMAGAIVNISILCYKSSKVFAI